VEAGEGLLHAVRVVQGDARGAEPGDAEGHRDAVIAMAGDAGGCGPGGGDLDPVPPDLDRDAERAQVLGACLQPVALLDPGVVDVWVSGPTGRRRI
jgi:hypothetical protein